jgi:hypothetical protein
MDRALSEMRRNLARLRSAAQAPVRAQAALCPDLGPNLGLDLGLGC